MKLGITMPSRTAAMSRIPDYARLAEEDGFDSVWTYEVYRNPFAMLCTSALSTSTIQLGTGLAAAFPRSPFECANAAADVDELSGGRMSLGLGTGVPEFLAAFHSTDYARPVGRLREYVECLRRSWAYLGGENVEPYQGTTYAFTPPPFNPWGLRELARPQIPILMAAMRPQLLSLCGQLGDGWIGYLATPEFMQQRVLPGIERGCRKAGRDITTMDIAADVICTPHPDREVAMHRAKLHVGFYVSHPVSDVVAELHGVQDDIAYVRQQLMSRGLDGLADTPESLVELFAIAGTPEECRQQLDQYTVLPHVVLHTPYVPPFTAEESEDCYQQIIDTFGKPPISGT
jgi:alkanesulfonate monooxygenase SsuD/methylene tetrahydromethanopterin reductase-like flavin-dependent oxidoreductase (luciferase family)